MGVFQTEFLVDELGGMKFGKLRMADFAALRDAMIEDNKANIRAQAVNDGYKTSHLPELLFMADSDKGALDFQRISASAYTPEGCRRILRMSLARVGGTDAQADEICESVPQLSFDIAWRATRAERVPDPPSVGGKAAANSEPKTSNLSAPASTETTPPSTL